MNDPTPPQVLMQIVPGTFGTGVVKKIAARTGLHTQTLTQVGKHTYTFNPGPAESVIRQMFDDILTPKPEPKLKFEFPDGLTPPEMK